MTTNLGTARSLTSLGDLLRLRAQERPDDRAYMFVSDRGEEQDALTFAQLECRARGLAGRLAPHAVPGDRALLLFRPGLDFIVAFFGCLLAGVIAVPMMIPRRASAHDASAAIVADCAPRVAITNLASMAARPDMVERRGNGSLTWLALDSPAQDSESVVEARPRPAPTPPAARADIAFLQYTSGSTSAPKGVMVSHGNLLENLEMIRRAFGNTRSSTHASWLPLYHDMGLILNVLQSLYIGAPCALLAPGTFMQRPIVWLHAIHRYRAEVAGAPNFAFDLCASRIREDQIEHLDLSCWKVAFNGAEPVRADTIARFAARFARCGFDPQAIYPAYGLAEATLFVSGGRRGAGVVKHPLSRTALQSNAVADPADAGDRIELVGCGRAAVGERIAIVHPDTRRRLPSDSIGEIWVDGPNCAQGYWRNADATRSTFQAEIADEPCGRWLRTGDLGFIDRAGELIITGRIKDVIIIRGINHYPQDIENTMQNSHPALRRHGGAAFAVAHENGEERLVVVQEVERGMRHRLDAEDVRGAIREAIVTGHEIAPDRIVLIRPGTLPKTTSGKVRRRLTRQLFEQDQLDVVD